MRGGMDTQLVVRAQHGDLAAFESLATALYGRLNQVAYRILRDRSLAEDATQAAVLGVWRNLPRLRDPDRFEAWSYRLLVNACHSEARRSHRWMPNAGGVPADVPLWSDELGAVVDRDELERAFRGLSVDHRAVLVLHHYLDLPVEDVAAALGIPVGTVNSRLHRAMQRMRLAMRAAPAIRPRELLPEEANP